ncbi:MAG: ABC transporter substrate-binding protein, partial [Thermomicrobiaceae bacterium]|nr:ABC transporter substrate-binding protein [Thermomicrobiaceae bacterium]
DPARSTLFLDPRVRRALMLALNRGAAVEAIWGGRARVADGTLPPASWAYAASGTTYAQRRDEAERLLAEAGWLPGPDGVRVKDGQPLRFTLTTNGENPQRRRAAEWLAESWRAIGVDAVIDFEKWSGVKDRVAHTRDFQALLLECRWDVDPDQTALFSSDSFFDGLNAGHYANAQVDALLEKALESRDPAERKRLYAQAQDAVMKDLPVLPLWFPELTLAISDRLHDVNPTAILVRNRANIERWVPATAKR